MVLLISHVHEQDKSWSFSLYLLQVLIQRYVLQNKLCAQVHGPHKIPLFCTSLTLLGMSQEQITFCPDTYVEPIKSNSTHRHLFPCNEKLGHVPATYLWDILFNIPLGYFLKNLSPQHVPQSLCNKPLSLVPVTYPWDISPQHIPSTYLIFII